MHHLTATAALARQKCELNSVGAEDAAEQIGDRDSGTRRTGLLGTRETHEAAYALCDLVEARTIAVGPVRTEA